MIYDLIRQEIEGLGVVLWMEDPERIRFQGEMTAEVAALIKQHREGLRAYLWNVWPFKEYPGLREHLLFCARTRGWPVHPWCAGDEAAWRSFAASASDEQLIQAMFDLDELTPATARAEAA